MMSKKLVIISLHTSSNVTFLFVIHIYIVVYIYIYIFNKAFDKILLTFGHYEVMPPAPNLRLFFTKVGLGQEHAISLFLTRIVLDFSIQSYANIYTQKHKNRDKKVNCHENERGTLACPKFGNSSVTHKSLFRMLFFFQHAYSYIVYL